MSFLGIAFLIFVVLEVIAVFVGLYFQRHPEKHERMMQPFNRLEKRIDAALEKISKDKFWERWVP